MKLTDGIISLRGAVEADAEAIASAVRSSADELGVWMPWAGADYDAEAALGWIRRELDPTDDPTVLIAPDGSIAGSCGLNKVDMGNQVANLGYWLRSDCTGQGWATAASLLVARHAFDELGLHRVEIVMSTQNLASRRVAEKVGATHEGVLRETLLLHGAHHDAHMFSLLPSDLS